MTMRGLEPVLVMLLLASAITALVTAVVGRVDEHSRRKRFLRRVASGGPSAPRDSTAPAEIFRQSGQQAGRWLKLLRHAPLFRGSGHMLEQAGLDWSSATFARLTAACGAGAGFAAFFLSGSPMGGLLGAGAGMLMPRLYVRRRRRKRLEAIEEQLAAAIDLLTRAIRAGHALTTALRMVADESADPLASEFRRVFDEQKYGLRFEESLRELTRRVDLADIRVMVIAILVQREVGGNLAEILDNIGKLIRNRFMLRRQVQVYTAQGRMSGWVLGGLPVALGGVIYLMNPDYIRLLFTDPAGQAMLGAGVALQMIGYFWISRILKLDY